MTLAPLFLVILIYATMLWSPCRPFDDVYIYRSNERQQGKIKGLSRELVLDAERKLMAVQGYRDQYYKSLQYQLGDIVYELRDYYKKMVNLYFFTERNVSYWYLNHNENIRTYVLIHRMALEVENKVDMVHEWQYKRASALDLHVRMNDPLAMRMGAEREDEGGEQLYEARARARMARSGGHPALPRRAPALPRRAPAPPQRAPAPAAAASAKRKNKKWQYVRG